MHDAIGRVFRRAWTCIDAHDRRISWTALAPSRFGFVRAQPIDLVVRNQPIGAETIRSSSSSHKIVDFVGNNYLSISFFVSMLQRNPFGSSRIVGCGGRSGSFLRTPCAGKRPRRLMKIRTLSRVSWEEDRSTPIRSRTRSDGNQDQASNGWPIHVDPRYRGRKWRDSIPNQRIDGRMRYIVMISNATVWIAKGRGRHTS